MEQFISEIEENEQEERAGFVIDNDQKADWASPLAEGRELKYDE